jgi:thiol-disulfide isomerase/thioredoxin
MSFLLETLMKSASWLLVLGFFLPSFLEGEEIPPEKFKKLKELYQKAHSNSVEKAYDKSNDVLKELLSLLPRKEPLDLNRARVHYDMACNYSLLGKKKDALDSLNSAVESGFWDHDYLTKDGTLKDLREEKGFKDLSEKCRRALAEMAFGLKDISGKTIDKKDYKDKVLILDVWGTWCPPCRTEIPHFVKLQEKYRDKGLRIIGLTWEKRAPDESIRKNVESFAQNNKVNYPLALLSESLLSAIPNMEGFPTTFFIGRDGLIAERVLSYHEYADLEAIVVTLLEQKSKT